MAKWNHSFNLKAQCEPCPHSPNPVHLGRPPSSADVSCLQILRRLLIKVWQVKVKSTLYSTAAFGNDWLQEEYLILIILTIGFLLTLLFPVAFIAVHVPVVPGTHKHYWMSVTFRKDISGIPMTSCDIGPTFKTQAWVVLPQFQPFKNCLSGINIHPNPFLEPQIYIFSIFF